MIATTLVYFLILGSLSTYATPFTHISARSGVTALSVTQSSSFRPFSFYAAAAYCNPSTTQTWSCASCQGNPGFIPVETGGDGVVSQFWYVGFDPGLQTVIVAHQGTDVGDIIPLITDFDIILSNLDENLFPGIDSSILVHSGFRDAQANTATAVLAAVTQVMSQYNTTDVTIVGHSLGGAISLLDSVYLPLNLPAGTVFRTITYGLPRVGNQAFADYVDQNLDFTHVNNMEDIVPTLPGKFFGFVHPSGEVHIEDTGSFVSCTGQDNPDPQCIVGDVPDIFAGSLSDHDGPYNGATMSC